MLGPLFTSLTIVLILTPILEFSPTQIDKLTTMGTV
jgi:hypothetical protein